MYCNISKLLDDATCNEIAATCILQLHPRRVVVTSFHGCDLLPKVDYVSLFLSSSFSHAWKTLFGKTLLAKSDDILDK